MRETSGNSSNLVTKSNICDLLKIFVFFIGRASNSAADMVNDVFNVVLVVH